MAAHAALPPSEAVWLFAIYERQGRTGDMAALARKPWIRFRNDNNTFKALLKWDL